MMVTLVTSFQAFPLAVRPFFPSVAAATQSPGGAEGSENVLAEADSSAAKPRRSSGPAAYNLVDPLQEASSFPAMHLRLQETFS